VRAKRAAFIRKRPRYGFNISNYGELITDLPPDGGRTNNQVIGAATIDSLCDHKVAKAANLWFQEQNIMDIYEAKPCHLPTSPMDVGPFDKSPVLLGIDQCP
jgi:hypothetical protein